MIPNQLRDKALYLLIVFVFSVILLNLSIASASIYDNPVEWYQPANLWIFSWATPVQAMHDCSDDGGHCMAVVYDTYWDELKVFWISDPELNTSWCPLYPNPSCSQPPLRTVGIQVDFPYATNDNYSNWHLAFGVVYSPTNNKYYVWKKGQVYYYPITGDAELLVRDYTLSGGYPCRTFIGQGEDEFGEPFLWALDRAIPDIRKYYPYNDTLLAGNQMKPSGDWIKTTPEHPYPSAPCTGIVWAKWFYAVNSLNESAYVLYNYSRTGTSPYFTVEGYRKNYEFLNTNFNSSHFYIDGMVYGARESYPSATDGIYTSTTSDFLTFGTPALYYTYNSSVAEDINVSWGVRTEKNKIYQFDRWRNTSDADRGIGVHIADFNRILVSTGYISASGDVYPAVVTMELKCRDNNWTSGSVTGDFEEFFTECSNLTLVFDTIDYLPYHAEYNFTYPDDCSSFRLDFDFRSRHDLDIYIRDFFDGTPVSGVSVNVNSVIRITDSNGLVEYSLNPFEDVEFELHYTVSDCHLQYQGEGDAKAYSLYATKTGYFPISGEVFTITDYPSQKTFHIKPIHAQVTVNVFTSDGVPVETSLVSVVSTGANETYVMSSEGIPLPTNVATRFPAIFRLFDDRSSYTAVFNLTQVGYYEVKNQVIDSGISDYTINFYLPDSIECIACTTLSHCPESFCKGTYFYELVSCTDGCCVYDVEACLVCDAEVGCYDETGTETCYFDIDCEDVCYNSATLRESNCGSENICLYHYIDCPYGCIDVAEGEDYCESAPDIAYCDQSTVTGMLTCLQAGILGFITGVYDPMMYLVVVIFLVIIVVSMLSLAFRGTQRVIR